MKNITIALACLVAESAFAQIGGYLGPGVLSRGAGDIGNRSGQQVDLRLYADVSAVYDNGIIPFALDSKGNLIQINGLYGAMADLGAYGTHDWSKARLGLDYRGDFYHYVNNSFYDGSTHNLTLGYTYQKSRRLVFDLRQVAGTSSLGFAGPGFFSPAATDVVNQPTTLLFDNRTYYVQSTMDVSYIQSARTIYTFGGYGFLVRRLASGLANSNGYDLQGRIQHRLSRTRTIGVTYEHVHYDFAPSFGQSDINTFEGFFSAGLGRRWAFHVSAGAFQAEVQGVQQVALNPVVASLLGQSTGIQAFYRASVYPSGGAALNAKFKTSTLGFSYTRTVSPGNGVYLTSRADDASANYSYTGLRKWNLGVSGGYDRLGAIGQGIQPYSQLTGGAGFTYRIAGFLHLVGRYDARHQEIDVVGYRRTSYRATLGFGFSPGPLPLSLW